MTFLSPPAVPLSISSPSVKGSFDIFMSQLFINKLMSFPKLEISFLWCRSELDPDDAALSRSESTLARYETQLLDRAKSWNRYCKIIVQWKSRKTVRLLTQLNSIKLFLHVRLRSWQPYELSGAICQLILLLSRLSVIIISLDFISRVHWRFEHSFDH